MALDEVEPFDEWEDFALFASHYFLLVAKHQSDRELTSVLPVKLTSLPTSWGVNGEYRVRMSKSSDTYPKKRFASVIDQICDRQQLGHVSGLGPQTRTATVDFYMVGNETPADATGELPYRFLRGGLDLPNGSEPRMCHTSTKVDPKGLEWLVVGGRKSPDQPLSDCWLLRNQRWQRANSLPIPLYRHCQTHVLVALAHTLTPAVLVYGGKTLHNTISSKWFLWQGTGGWLEVITEDVDLPSRFGAVMVSNGHANGVLIGGMTEEGTICHDFWLWSLTYDDAAGWKIRLAKQHVSKGPSDSQALRYLYRFGASIERTYNSFLLIGGVADEIIPECYEVIEISLMVSSYLFTLLVCILASRPIRIASVFAHPGTVFGLANVNINSMIDRKHIRISYDP